MTSCPGHNVLLDRDIWQPSHQLPTWIVQQNLMINSILVNQESLNLSFTIPSVICHTYTYTSYTTYTVLFCLDIIQATSPASWDHNMMIIFCFFCQMMLIVTSYHTTKPVHTLSRFFIVLCIRYCCSNSQTRGANKVMKLKSTWTSRHGLSGPLPYLFSPNLYFFL